MTKHKINIAKTKENAFCNTFDSMQLLNLTVLYYNFNFSKEKLKEVGKLYMEHNYRLDDSKWCGEMGNRLNQILGCRFQDKVRKFPYRALVKMMSVPMKGNVQMITMIYDSGLQSIYSLCLLVLGIMIEHYHWGKTEIELWWSNIISNAENYKNGMTDHFVAEYFRDQIDLDLSHENGSI